MTDSMITLRGAAGITGVSWGGKWYPAFNGQVVVPADAEPDLTRPLHGFVKVPTVVRAPPANVTKLAKPTKSA